MNYKPLTVLCVALLGGCPMTVPNSEDGGISPTDGKCQTVQPDMLTVLPKCAAATGLTGDNLLCVDFKSITDQSLAATPPSELTGWDFVTNCGGMNWEIASGKLQIKNFGQFASNCGLTLKPITMAQIQTYKRLTLSIQQRIDLIDPDQQAQIFLDSDTPSTRVMWQDTGRRDVPRQQTVITIDSAELPQVLKGGFKWFFKISSPAGFPRNGWQIESIAVNGST